MCGLCASGLGNGGELTRRARMLQLLALVEHPDALPADAALRLCREIMMLASPRQGSRQCDAVAPSGPKIEQTR
jgi:hypothetical protein